mmetsp:Transcript_276/g.447  ORF Transcript_276/g.447 Transcript_276/m.447 type:complete len:221 (-) Transcript_276:40-702(-)
MTSLVHILTNKRPQEQYNKQQSLLAMHKTSEKILYDHDDYISDPTKPWQLIRSCSHNSEDSQQQQVQGRMCSNSSAQHGPSKSIPIRHSLERTESELQLCEDEAMADYRDYVMYARIVSGMSNRISPLDDSNIISHHDYEQHHRQQVIDPIYNIMRTRQGLPSHNENATSGTCLNQLDSMADDIHLQYSRYIELEQDEQEFYPQELSNEEEEYVIFELDL